MRYEMISADCHIDLPLAAARSLHANASAGAARPHAVRHRRARRARTGRDEERRRLGLPCGVGSAGRRSTCPGSIYRADVMAATGLYADGKKGIRRPTDPELRIKDMERDGVQAEVIFGILGAATRLNDPEAAVEMFRIYNDWLVDFCRHYPDRHIGLACLPYGDIDAAVQEIHRVAKLGLRGLELSCSWDMEPMWHPVVGAALEGGRARWACRCTSTPSRPSPPSVREKATGLSQARRPLHRRLRLPDEPRQHPGRRHRRRGARALPEPPHLVRRERHRLDPLRARPHGLRVGGPLPRPRPHDEAERLLAAAVQGAPSSSTASAPSSSTRWAWRRSCGAPTIRTPTACGRSRRSTSRSSSATCPPTTVHKIICENAGKFYGLMT